MRVVDPSGQRWLVRRRWRAEHLGRDGHGRRLVDRSASGLRWSRAGDWADLIRLGDLAEVPVIGVVFLVIALLALLALAVLFVIPVLIALGELVLLVALAVVGVVGRLAFRRPWTVEAINALGHPRRWSVLGWRASGAARRFVAERLVATGTPPAPDEVAAAALLA